MILDKEIKTAKETPGGFINNNYSSQTSGIPPPPNTDLYSNPYTKANTTAAQAVASRQSKFNRRESNAQKFENKRSVSTRGHLISDKYNQNG